jgi:hypothetical protein
LKEGMTAEDIFIPRPSSILDALGAPKQEIGL